MTPQISYHSLIREEFIKYKDSQRNVSLEMAGANLFRICYISKFFSTLLAVSLGTSRAQSFQGEVFPDNRLLSPSPIRLCF
ncbi:hypothetical protein Lal_00009998 [Lupinus albus]|nr:hypothetical protein Lal_00009998 [Lupinus albus]